MKTGVIVAVLLIISLPRGHAQVAEIAAGATVEEVIGQLRNSLTQVISEAESSTSVVSFSVAADANILLQNLTVAVDDLRGKLFRDLNVTQQATFANALKFSKETNRDLNSNITMLQGAVKLLGAELSRIPGVSKRPLVQSYEPSYMVNNDAAYDFSFGGSLLHSEKSSLTFGATPCKYISADEQKIRFQCPAEPFVSNSNDWRTGTLLLFKGNDRYEYQIAVKVIQERLGTFTLLATETRTVASRVARTVSNGFRNKHCGGSVSKVWTYRPAKGCYVDVAAIKDTVNKSSKSSYEGVINASPSGFQLRGMVINNGKCGPFGVPKDGRGSLNVTAQWVDVCDQQREVQLEPQTGEVSWEAEQAFKFSPSMTSFMFVLVQANGERKVVTGAEASDWFTTTYDPAMKVLVFKPRNVKDIFK